MRVNDTMKLALSGQAAIGTMCNAASPLIAETLGHCGYDFVLIDLQHGENSLATVQVLLQAISSTPATPMVRVPGNDPISIQRVLDLGAYGVIVPFINNREEALSVVANTCYPPLGVRSWGPARGSIYGGSDYFTGSATEVMTLVMLESAEGLANARDILTVEGVHGCFVGPADLNISLGFSPDDPALSPETEKGIADICAVAKSLGKIAGIHAVSFDDAKRRVEQGFTFVTAMADTRLIRIGAQQSIKAARG